MQTSRFIVIVVELDMLSEWISKTYTSQSERCRTFICFWKAPEPLECSDFQNIHIAPWEAQNLCALVEKHLLGRIIQGGWESGVLFLCADVRITPRMDQYSHSTDKVSAILNTIDVFYLRA